MVVKDRSSDANKAREQTHIGLSMDRPAQPVIEFAQDLAKLIFPSWGVSDYKYFDKKYAKKNGDRDLDRALQADRLVEIIELALEM